MKLLCSLILLLNSASAFAFCPMFDSLKQEIATCEDNLIIGNKAVECLERYTAHVASGQARVHRALTFEMAKSLADQSASMQSGNYQLTMNSYQKAQNELQRLAADGIQAKLAVDSYLEKLYFPEDWDMPSVTGMSVVDYLRSNPCFAVPRDSIMTAARLLTKMTNDLQRTDAAAAQKNLLTNINNGKIQALGNQQAPLKRVLIKDDAKGKESSNSGVSGTVDPRDGKK